jgi:hypothetical protein
VKPYSTKYGKKPWQTCSLRRWLNGEFYCGLSPNAQMRIANASMVDGDHLNHNTKGGNDITDKIFLLSLTGIQKYFPDNESRIARLTAQAVKEAQILAKRNDYELEFYEGETHWWWTRPSDYIDYSIVHIDSDGSFRRHSINDVNNELGGVRPALWLDWAMVAP